MYVPFLQSTLAVLSRLPFNDDECTNDLNRLDHENHCQVVFWPLSRRVRAEISFNVNVFRIPEFSRSIVRPPRVIKLKHIVTTIHRHRANDMAMMKITGIARPIAKHIRCATKDQTIIYLYYFFLFKSVVIYKRQFM